MAGKTHRIGPCVIDTAKAFASEEACHQYLEASRWPEGVRCLKCDGDKISKFTVKGVVREYADGSVKPSPDRFMYQCLNAQCKYQFAATTGTIFSDTHLPLSKWMMAVALMCNAKKGVSAKQMERDLGVSYKTAWYLNHRIRKAMIEEGGDIFTGVVEMDEAYIAGKFDKRRVNRGRYAKEKPVFGIIERGGDVRAYHMDKITKEQVFEKIAENVAPTAKLMTDDSNLYKSLKKIGYSHEIINHTQKKYVRGDVHTNTIENFWSLFKRGVIGSFHQVSIKHLNRYLAEFQFRFNNRRNEEIFALVVLNLVINTGIRYADLTASEEAK